MSNKKMSENTKERITLGVIIGGVLICAACVLSSIDFRQILGSVTDGFKDQFSDVGNIASNIGDAFNDNAFESAIADIESGLQGEMGDEFSELQSVLEENGVISKDDNNSTSPDNFMTSSTATAQTTAPTVDDEIKGTIVRVKDGDTYVVNIDGEDTTVRLIGVDTPESVAPASYGKENTEDGKTVADIVKAKLQKGDTVIVEYDVSKTDRYNRTLAYLYFEDGTMIQDWLLVNGYAQVMTIQPNSKYADHFAELQHEAAENKIGLWNGFFDEKR